MKTWTFENWGLAVLLCCSAAFLMFNQCGGGMETIAKKHKEPIPIPTTIIVIIREDAGNGN